MQETLKHDAILHACQQSDPQRQSETLKHDEVSRKLILKLF